MELDPLIAEYASHGIRVGERLYGELMEAARTAVRTRRYPPSYSPTGDWQEDSLTGVAHEWIAEKLLRLGHLEHLLLSNEDLRGFRTGLQLSFAHYVLGQRKRTALDHLFRRTNVVLESDARFRRVSNSPKKALRAWGLTDWNDRAQFSGRDEELIAAGFRLNGFPVVWYRADAQKESPILRDRDIGDFVERLLKEIDTPLSLAQICVVYKYRFNLLSDETLSLDEVVRGDEGEGAPRGDAIGSGGVGPEDEIVYGELAELVFQEMSPRQKLCFRSYNEPGATLSTVATEARCSKSTVENEVKATVSLLERHTRSADEAEVVYDRLLTLLDAESDESR